jgi:LuxR family maltose regulon positive regulatory protein
LTESELRNQRLLDGGLSDREIAHRLSLALGTVKWYTSQIYGKLGVDNRTRAAARARELGLLQ